MAVCGRSSQYFFGQRLGFQVPYWQHALLEEGEDVIAVGVVFQQAAESGGGLEIGRSVLLDKNHMLKVDPGSAGLGVVDLVVNEDEKGVAQAVDLLAGALERAGRLRLANACHLDFHLQTGEVDAGG